MQWCIGLARLMQVLLIARVKGDRMVKELGGDGLRVLVAAIVARFALTLPVLATVQAKHRQIDPPSARALAVVPSVKCTLA